MKRYEGLFILDTAGKEETIKDTIDKLSADISAAGGKVETVQNMDKRHPAGFYVNIIFEAEPAIVEQLKHRFAMNDDVFRVLFNKAAAPKPAATAVA